MGGSVTTSGGSAIGARLSAMMFLQFFTWGAWYVSMGTFLGASEQLKPINAWAYSLVPIAAIISPFFLGVVADRFFATERILAVLHILGGVVMLAIPGLATQDPNLFLGLLGLHALCYVPTLGLTNSLAFRNVTNGEKQFPLIRVFGTIGWIVANWVVSFGLHADTTAAQFYVAGIAAVVLGLYSLTLPHTPPPAAGQKPSVGDIMGLDALALLKQRSFAVFMLCSFLICIPLAAYYQLANRFVDAVGFENPTGTMSLGQMSEIFFMLVMPLFFARLGVKKMLLVGMLAWVLRYGLFAGAWDQRVQWMVLGGIVLHGICYDFFFVTGQIYVDKQAPAAIRSQAQGFLVWYSGLGMFIGAQVMGWIEAAYTAGDAIQWQGLWIIPCVAAAVISVIFFLLFREDTSEQ
jgi:nucleoside transporter